MRLYRSALVAASEVCDFTHFTPAMFAVGLATIVHYLIKTGSSDPSEWEPNRKNIVTAIGRWLFPRASLVVPLSKQQSGRLFSSNIGPVSLEDIRDLIKLF